MGLRKRLSERVDGGEQREPDWAVVLETLYKSEPPLEPKGESATQMAYNIDALVAGSELYDGRVDAAVEKLRGWGLVETEKRGSVRFVELTDDGFTVAHERRLSERRRRTNEALVVFTAFLVIAQIIGVVPAPVEAKFASALFVLFGLLYIAVWTNILE